MSQTLISKIDAFVELSIKQQLDQIGRAPLTTYDPEWPSDCLQSVAEPDQPVNWLPVRQPDSSNSCDDMFDRLEQALGYSIHLDLRTWYRRYWSEPLPATSDWGDLSLLFLWSEKDCERLRGNLVGHLLTKQKQKRPPTLFFACTEPDGEKFLSIDNQTGEVWLEQPGKKPIMKLADSLALFLDKLTPKTIPDLEQ
ncbi:SecY-interacting protein [Amphritea sp. 2_MG-2023]|jgi:SecY interacting protein Syd|uniref:SecY-interacting protein n=1 Tax=Amphritea TaxID=515417 RepID=UPI001C065C66|nr:MULTISPECIES: SecY-interacting protein [Amphritea]MBU2966433.1 SecY-interacting protein [Amphritea atlantica]MDO6419871.1 SecY-interacting protein [Amphritea sp. 2_MG-2023]